MHLAFDNGKEQGRSGIWIKAGNKVKRKGQLGGFGLIKEGVTT